MGELASIGPKVLRCSLPKGELSYSTSMRLVVGDWLALLPLNLSTAKAQAVNLVLESAAPAVAKAVGRLSVEDVAAYGEHLASEVNALTQDLFRAPSSNTTDLTTCALSEYFLNHEYGPRCYTHDSSVFTGSVRGVAATSVVNVVAFWRGVGQLADPALLVEVSRNINVFKFTPCFSEHLPPSCTRTG